MKVTKKMRAEIKAAVDKYNGVYKLADYIGVSHSSIYRWLNGTITDINPEIYSRINPNGVSVQLADKKERKVSNSVFIQEAMTLYLKDKNKSTEELDSDFNLTGKSADYINNIKCKLRKNDFDKINPVIKEYYDFSENQERLEKLQNRENKEIKKGEVFFESIEILRTLPKKRKKLVYRLLKGLAGSG